uniref:Trimethylguanosine synthase n=1 Tax=Spodoptera frugiperda TaxID=7108 RepID=A0A2H1VEG5_SPOFR
MSILCWYIEWRLGGKLRECDRAREYGLGTRNERGTRLLEFYVSKKITIKNTCFQHHPRRLYTWISPGDRYRNQIDYSWFSVTPKVVARHIAEKYQYDVVLDAFCGAGGNTIQFARTYNRVVAIDIDPNKIAMTKHNATIYGVHEKIEFITGDFFELAPRLKADMVFLSPPWGGPSYSKAKEYEVESMLRPRPASELMQVARTISPNVELFLPRNTRHDQFTPGLWASSTQEEFSLMSSLGRRVRDLSQDLVHQRALPLVESRGTRGKSD